MSPQVQKRKDDNGSAEERFDEGALRLTQLTVDRAGDYIYWVSTSGRIVYANESACRRYGYSKQEMKGLGIDDIAPNLSTDSWRKRWRKMKAEGSSTLETTHRAKDGELFPVEVTANYVAHAGGEYDIAFVRDISERKRAEADRENLLCGQQALTEELAVLNDKLLIQNERLRVAQEQTAHLYREQSSLVSRLQEALLDIPAELPGVRFGHLYRSATREAKVGGDFYDVFEAKHGHIGLLIGDVSGHGVEAARIATLAKDTVHAFAHQFCRPQLVLRETNRLLVEKNLPGFVTAFLGFLDPEVGTLTYSSAGHPAPLLKVGEHVGLLKSINSPLGVFADARYRDRKADIPKGSLLVFYTDGITEARRDGVLFGEEGLVAALMRLDVEAVETLPDLLLDEALIFSGGHLEDDVAVLAVNYDGGIDS